MKEYIKIIRNWARLSNPNKKFCFLTFLFTSLAQTCLLISPIFAAKATISLTSGLYYDGAIYLIIVFVFLVLFRTLWHGHYITYSRIVKKSYDYLNNKIVYKSVHANHKNFKETSKEHILNTIHTDVMTLASFGDKLAIASGRFVVLIATIIVIFIVNMWAGFIVVFADIINYFVYGWLNKKRVVHEKRLREYQDLQYDKVSEMVDTRMPINEFGIYKKVEKDYSRLLKRFNQDLKNKTFWDSMVDNYYLVFYNFIILCATILLVYFTSTNAIQIETYFVIVAYVITGIQDTNNIFALIPNIRLTKIATERVKTIINFVDSSKDEKGKIKLNDILGSIYFKKVSYKKDKEGNPELKDFDVFFEENKTHLILGLKKSGKRTVFNLLSKSIKPTKGQIFMDGVDIYEYDKKSYIDNISYLITKPMFFRGSVMKNLKLVEKNKNIIFQVCKEVGIYDYIQALPNNFNTDINNLPYEISYLVALARAILTRTEILIIYEFPTNLNEEEKSRIKELINKMHGTRTIIIFSAQEYCVDLADKIVQIEKGEIKDIQYRKNENRRKNLINFK